MKAKERLTRALEGRETDKIPWSPFLAYFWEYQSQEVQKKGPLAFLEEIGADPLLRGGNGANAFTVDYGSCEVKETTKGKDKQTLYPTPFGDLVMEHRLSHKSWFITRHPVKNAGDLEKLTWIQEQIKIKSTIDALNESLDELGERALAIPTLGHLGKTCFQSLLESWCGTENLVYLVMDNPHELDQCLHVMKEKSLETVRLSARSKGEYFLSWEDTSTTNINPAYYENYILPEINSWCDVLHGEGKKYIQHACGHLKNLLPLIGASKIDGIESVSSPPTGDIEFTDFRDGLPNDKSMIGGIEPVFFENASLVELEQEVIRLAEHCKGTPFIMANSDSCPPGVTREKMELVSRILKKLR
jgi:uroporphyrinogen-III decarboxylase